MLSRHTESERLASLKRLRVLDTPPEPAFDGLVRAAARVCGVPMSQLTLIDADRQWFKASVGFPGPPATPREYAFCDHAIAEGGLFEVLDATLDPRFADNPLVTGEPRIRFYAGVTLRLSGGAHVGTLCVIDRVPRTLTAEQREILTQLSEAAVGLLEARRATHDLALGDARFHALGESSSLGVFSTDSEGACTGTNERWQSIFGVSAEDAREQGWSEGVHPEDRTALLAGWQRAASRGLDFASEFRVRQLDGAVRFVRAVSRSVRSADGELEGHVGTVEDVTERVLQHAALEDAHRKLQMATDSGRIGVWEWDVSRDVTTWTPQMFALYGLAAGPERIHRDLWLDRVHPEDRESVRRRLEVSLSGEDRLDGEYRIVWHDGSIRHLRVSAHVTRDADGAAVQVTGVNWDVTPLRRLTEELADQHELLKVTLESIGDAVITTDALGRITWQNPVAEQMTGWLSAEAVGRPFREVFHVHDARTRRPIEDPVKACASGARANARIRHALLVDRDGRRLSIENSAAPIRDREGVVLGTILVFRDVTEQRRLASEMNFRATHDALTGLLNRTEFERRLEARLGSARGDRTEDALMYIDLDQFMLVNDACGHAAGDELLRQVGGLFGEIVRGGDALARLGGDEFGVILEHCSGDRASRLAQQICDRMKTFRFEHDGRRFQIGTSIGLVPLDGRWEDTSALMQAADVSCHAAKEAGRNRVHEWFDTDKAMRGRRGDMRWATRLAQALDEERLVLHAQRIEALDPGGEGLRAEMLVRLRETDGSLIMPGVFLPAAERYHVITRLDRWVLRSTIELLSSLSDVSGVELLCVNLSGHSIGDRIFHQEAMALLDRAGAGVCRRLCFEVTETAAVTNLVDAALFIDRVRALGVRVALDDFGAGASSFGYLRMLSVDSLKIDGQFIRGLAEDPLNEAAVRSFVEAARVLGLTTVAEFVDSPATLEQIRRLGVDYAQGHLLHAPEVVDRQLLEGKGSFGRGSAAVREDRLVMSG